MMSGMFEHEKSIVEARFLPPFGRKFDRTVVRFLAASSTVEFETEPKLSFNSAICDWDWYQEIPQESTVINIFGRTAQKWLYGALWISGLAYIPRLAISLAHRRMWLDCFHGWRRK